MATSQPLVVVAVLVRRRSTPSNLLPLELATIYLLYILTCSVVKGNVNVALRRLPLPFLRNMSQQAQCD
ncbi:MAG: hypothetical protein HS124_02250 [Anaerolineales bacterium]|nr:hypothetical protein [Anaerolineales bacterium]MCL4261260.1 hypothetical protein [Anaerolineales bacterium]